MAARAQKHYRARPCSRPDCVSYGNYAMPAIGVCGFQGNTQSMSNSDYPGEEVLEVKPEAEVVLEGFLAAEIWSVSAV